MWFASSPVHATSAAARNRLANETGPSRHLLRGLADQPVTEDVRQVQRLLHAGHVRLRDPELRALPDRHQRHVLGTDLLDLLEVLLAAGWVRRPTFVG